MRSVTLKFRHGREQKLRLLIAGGGNEDRLDHTHKLGLEGRFIKSHLR